MRRQGRAIRWIAGLVVLVLVGSGLGVQAYLALPPSLRQLESRIISWDASGDGGAYRIFGYEERLAGEINVFERIVHLDGHEYLLRNGNRIYHQRGTEYYITFDSSYKGAHREPTVGRTVDLTVPFGPMPARVLSRTSERFYTGILGSHGFSLELDEEERVQTLSYQNHRADRVRLHYDYSGIRFPAFVRTSAEDGQAQPVRHDTDEITYASLPRNAANFPQPEPNVAKGRVVIDWHQDTRPATDFLVRFTSDRGELMAETPMSSVALPGGFSFVWEDLNANGWVDEGDLYTYAHPSGLRMSFYDLWARQPVGSPRREGPWDPQWDLVTPSWRLYNLRQSS